MGADVTLRQDGTLGNVRAPGARAPRLAAVVACAAALAGCGGGAGASGGAAPSTASRLASLIAFGGAEPVKRDPAAPQLRSCPEATVLDGGAALRVGGPASQSVRHQFAIVDVARECQIQNGQLVIKVGVEGNLLIGPAGSGGTHSASIRVALRAEKDQRVVASRSYRVSATSSGGQTAPFTLVTEPFVVPFINEYAGDDYTVSIGFEGTRSTVAAGGRRRR
jgi:hypothetical protein